jgi:hypothetical protein
LPHPFPTYLVPLVFLFIPLSPPFSHS